ncbi:MAG: hypothetical protein HOH58_17740 [Opitutaceae bacterium]|jgi:negative regulator of replication initiation|nr:hypothetical protein [Opitutaceae bacterium]
MKKIEVTDEVYEALRNLTSDFNQQPNDVLASLLDLPGGTGTSQDPLIRFLGSAEFRSLHKDADKYLAILGWVADQHPADFREYIMSLNRGRRHLSMSREEIIEQSRHNQARQIPQTPYWAIMNIDTPTKRRFLTRVLDFCGYAESLIEHTCNAIGMSRPTNRFRFLRP